MAKSTNKKAVAKEKVDFVNPLEQGISYIDFVKALEASNKSVSEYCKGKLSSDEINWLEDEIKSFKLNNK